MKEEPRFRQKERRHMLPDVVAKPARMAAGVPAWQVVLAVVLTLAAIAAATWLASRIYANSVLRTGARVGFLEALRGSGP